MVEIKYQSFFFNLLDQPTNNISEMVWNISNDGQNLT